MSYTEVTIEAAAAIAALISGYVRAVRNIEKIKRYSYEQDGSTSVTRLEQVLKEGLQEIQNVVDISKHTFGRLYGKGDDTAIKTIQDLEFQLQEAVSRTLIDVTTGDELNSVPDCTAKVERTTQETLHALSELHIRQEQRSRPAGLQGGVSAGEAPVEHPASPLKDEPSMKGSRKSVLKFFQRPTPARSPDATSTEPRSSPRPSLPQLLLPVPATQPNTPPVFMLPQPTNTRTPADTLKSAHMNSFRLGSAGFCKGAYRVQQQLFKDAVKMSTRNMEWSAHCKKCSFAVPAGKDGRFDDSIKSAYDVQFRSLFLFKSHVVGEKTQRCYKCLICVLSGESVSTYKGEDTFFQHISKHQGPTCNGVQLHGHVTMYSSGFELATEVDFDISFRESPGLPNSQAPSGPGGAIELE